RTIRANLVFVYLSVLSCTVPYVLLAFVNYEFPALLGGMIGTVTSIYLARKRIGLARTETEKTTDNENREGVSPSTLVKVTFPLWGTVLILVVTRIEQLGIKGFLTDPRPAFEAALGSFAHFAASPSLVVTLKSIFGADSTWMLQLLYIPAVLPFFAVSALSFALFRMGPAAIRDIGRESYQRMRKPIIALLGALVMVQLLMVGGEQSIVVLIGTRFAAAIGDNWIYFASFLGAVGSFFSGSATISNLTFGGIQDSIAATLGLDRGLVLSLQSVGGAMGNMVCINNIVAVCTILGITNREGFILKRTLLPMLAYGAIAALFGLIL
ncbi:MAG: L-lactate permease, partial [Rhodospirillales bacterium]|nr:L-lactate permease [Rhodospirillales bacterium]